MKDNQAKYPQLRFKGFTDPWEQRKLGDLAEIVRGASPRPIQNPKWFDDSSEIGWLRISDVTAQDGRIHRLEQHISVEGQEKTRVLTTPHLLLSIAATVGKPVINYISTGVHDGFLIFLKPRFELEFMFQWLENFRSSWQRYGQPGSQVNLNSGLVRKQTIYIPTREEQQKIAGFCEKLDNLITLHQRKLAKLKKLKQGYLQKMFPKNGEKVPELRFAGFADAWEQRSFKTLYKKVIEKNDLSFESDRIISVANMYYKPNDSKSDEKYMETYNIFRLGDIAFEGNKSKNFAYGRFVENTIGDGIVSHVFDVFRPISEYDLNYWKYFIHYEDIMGQKLRMSTTKATMMNNLVSKDFLKQSVLVPNLDEQQKIGTFFKQLDHLITLHQRKLEKLQELKKGYLQKMFC